MTAVDWQQLASDIGLDGHAAGSESARRAISHLIGTDRLVAAVDAYLDLDPGFELARQVLWLLKPSVARDRCYEVYKASSDPQRRALAVELLKVLADRSTIEWVPDILDDPDPSVQAQGAGIVDHIVWGAGIDPVEVQELLCTMETHANESVRRTHALVAEYLARRQE